MEEDNITDKDELIKKLKEKNYYLENELKNYNKKDNDDNDSDNDDNDSDNDDNNSDNNDNDDKDDDNDYEHLDSDNNSDIESNSSEDDEKIDKLIKYNLPNNLDNYYKTYIDLIKILSIESSNLHLEYDKSKFESISSLFITKTTDLQHGGSSNLLSDFFNKTYNRFFNKDIFNTNYNNIKILNEFKNFNINQKDNILNDFLNCFKFSNDINYETLQPIDYFKMIKSSNYNQITIISKNYNNFIEKYKFEKFNLLLIQKYSSNFELINSRYSRIINLGYNKFYIINQNILKIIEEYFKNLHELLTHEYIEIKKDEENNNFNIKLLENFYTESQTILNKLYENIYNNIFVIIKKYFNKNINLILDEKYDKSEEEFILIDSLKIYIDKKINLDGKENEKEEEEQVIKESEDEKLEDENSEDEKPEDEKLEDEKLEDEKLEDEKPEDEKLEDEKPEDEKPDDEKPKDEKPEDEKPEDEKSEDEKPQDEDQAKVQDKEQDKVQDEEQAKDDEQVQEQPKLQEQSKDEENSKIINKILGGKKKSIKNKKYKK